MRALILAAMMAGTAMPALAFQPTPDWPCIQGRQPSLSMGQVWTGPAPDETTAEISETPEIAAFAERIVQRRLPIEEAEAEIAEFAKTHDAGELTALMFASLNVINTHRNRLIDGISRYGHKQVALSKQVEERRAEMARLEAADPPDFDAIDAAEEALEWDQRVFMDRHQSLTYVCETPVILEQRLFALGRAIAGHLPK